MTQAKTLADLRLTAAQIDTLKPYEDRLRSAHRSNTVRALMKEDQAVLLHVWREISGDTAPHNWNCQSCLLALCKRLAVPYFSVVDASPAEKIHYNGIRQTRTSTKKAVKARRASK